MTYHHTTLIETTACKAVSHKGKMIAGYGGSSNRGFQPENYEWITELTTGTMEGRDPMTIDCTILTLAGHPPARTSNIASRMGDVPGLEGLRTHKDLRTYCLEGCAENAAEVRKCEIINCPFWAYPTGRNPHNPRRGFNPGNLLVSVKLEATEE